MTYYHARACVIRSYVIRAGGHLYTLYVIVIPWLRGIIVDNCPDSRGRSPSERAVSVR